MAKFEQPYVCKLADQELPEGLLTAMLKEHKSCAGVAIVGANEDFLGTFLISDQNKDSWEVPTVAGIQHLLSQHKDKVCFLSFGKFPTKYDDDSVPPYVALFDAEGNTTMSVFMDGDYEKKAKAGTDNSAAYQVYSRLILPQIVKAAKPNDDDPTKTYEDIASDPAFAELMKLMYEGSGSITIVSNAGHVTFGDMRKEFDWGWATNLCGWKAEVAKPEVPATKKAAAGLSFKKPDGLPAEPATGSAQVSLPATPAKAAASNGEEFTLAAPPSGWTKEQKRRWYLDYNIIDGKGVVPEGYKNCPKVKVRKALIDGTPSDTTVKDFKDIPKSVASNGQLNTDKHPIISPKGKEYIKNVFVKQGHVQKTLNEGRVVIDPKRAEALETDWPSFIEAGGLDDIRRTLGMSVEERADMIKNAPDAAEVLLQDTQLAYYFLLKEHNMLDLPKAGDTTTHQLAHEELKPAKVAAAGGAKNNLSFKKK